MSCAVQEIYLIVYVYSRAVVMHMFRPTWSIVHPCGCRLRSLIWVCLIVFAVRKDCVRLVSFGVALLFGS